MPEPILGQCARCGGNLTTDHQYRRPPMPDDLVARLRKRDYCEILLTSRDGTEIVMGPYLWVAMDGPDIRAMSNPSTASEVVLRKVGTEWQRPQSAALWEDVTIRTAMKGEDS